MLNLYFKRCIDDKFKDISVFQNIHYRWLQFNSDAIQTLISRRYPNKPVLPYTKLMMGVLNTCSSSCCMLGLGGGGIPLSLYQHKTIKSLTAVEISPDIISIAKQYFLNNKTVPLNIIQEDAKLFIAKQKNAYKTLIVDIYNAKTFPSFCNESLFFENCFNALKDQGIFIMNLVAPCENPTVFHNIREIFKYQTVVIPVPKCDNSLVVAAKNSSTTLLLQKLTAQQQAKHLKWDSLWGCLLEW